MCFLFGLSILLLARLDSLGLQTTEVQCGITLTKVSIFLILSYPSLFKSIISGIGQSIGNREQVISSMAMGNLVNGGNIGRSLSSGGLNMPGVASRLNLTGNS